MGSNRERAGSVRRLGIGAGPPRGHSVSALLACAPRERARSPLMPPLDRDMIRRLLAAQAARFCRIREVSRILASHPAEHLDALRGFVAVAQGRSEGTTHADVREGERALFAAIALAVAGDASGLEVLREPGRYFVTNSAVEVALAQIARVLLGDLQPPLSFINASMLGELAAAVGHRRAAPPPDEE